MPTPTDAEIAGSCRTAAKAIIDGTLQSYTAFGRTFNYLNVNDLLAMANELEARAARATSGPCTLADMRRVGNR